MASAKPVNQQGIVSKAVEKNAVASSNKPKSLRDYVQDMLPAISKALPKTITPERFTRITLTALSSNPKLLECTRDSFLGALMQAAQLGLEPNTALGQAYLIPYKNKSKGITECQFQVGYKGLIDLAYRSGEVANIQAHVVFANDEFEYELGLNPVLRHVPAKTTRGELQYVYGIFKLKNGGYGFEVMSRNDVVEHMNRYSQAARSGNSPWQTEFEEMAKKTVLKQTLKYAPMRSEFVQAIVADEGIVKLNDETAELDVIEIESSDPEQAEADFSALPLTEQLQMKLAVSKNASEMFSTIEKQFNLKGIDDLDSLTEAQLIQAIEFVQSNRIPL